MSTNEKLPLTQREKIVRRIIAPAAALAISVGFGHAVVEKIKTADEHSIAYLNDYPVKSVIVGPGDTPNELANQVTGGLSGQVRTDELQYIREQGLAHDPAGNLELEAGQVVTIPVPPSDK